VCLEVVIVLNYDAVSSGRWLVSAQKVETLCSPEIFVSCYHMAWYCDTAVNSVGLPSLQVVTERMPLSGTASCAV
jgi:hypothetical protein